jgi:very-short-patch-repair endonuclease
VAELAHRQHGVVSGAQLRALGLGRGGVQRGLEARRLHPVHRGVYAVGHRRLTSRGWMWAAILACGGPDLAVVSHRSAASLWDLLPTPVGAVEVTALRRSIAKPGVQVHRSRTLDAKADVSRHGGGLPVTAVTRTLIDLADVLAPRRLRKAVERAEILRLLDAGGLRARLDALPGRRTRTLTAILAELATREPDLTRSDLEELFLALVDRLGLPRPRVNVVVAGLEVDFLWPTERLIVETDGAATHLRPTAFEEDRRRDAALAVGGYRVVRFTWRRVVHEPEKVGATLRALLLPR